MRRWTSAEKARIESGIKSIEPSHLLWAWAHTKNTDPGAGWFRGFPGILWRRKRAQLMRDGQFKDPPLEEKPTNLCLNEINSWVNMFVGISSCVHPVVAMEELEGDFDVREEGRGVEQEAHGKEDQDAQAGARRRDGLVDQASSAPASAHPA